MKKYEKTYSRYQQHFCSTLKPHFLDVLLFDLIFLDFQFFQSATLPNFEIFEKLQSLCQSNFSVTERIIPTK